VRRHEAGLARELLGIPAVVGVEEGDQPAAGGADRVVARRRRAAVRRPLDQPDPRLAGGERPGEVAAAVGRGVVDEDQLPVGERLRPDRGDGVPKRRRRVPDRGDDADERRGRWSRW